MPVVPLGITAAASPCFASSQVLGPRQAQQEQEQAALYQDPARHVSVVR